MGKINYKDGDDKSARYVINELFERGYGKLRSIV